MTYIKKQGRTRSNQAWMEVSHLLQRVENDVSVIWAVFKSDTLNWEVDYLNCQKVDKEKWSLHPQVFQQLIEKCVRPDIDMLASTRNNKLPFYCSRMREPGAFTEALVILWKF